MNISKLWDALRSLWRKKRPTPAPLKSPFNVDWMDSYLAHWVVGTSIEGDRVADVEVAIQELADLRFDQRLAEIRDFVDRLRATGPDAGPPEPGVPPAGPAGVVFEPPDAGPPEPGVPPAGPAGVVFEPPDAGPPEPGVPPAGPAGVVFEPPDAGPPEPGVPPAGPSGLPIDDPSVLGENPWILYWFVSLKAPVLLDMIDAHFERRLADLRFEQR